jgi:DNA-binding NarL/FixJ family response regulator
MFRLSRSTLAHIALYGVLGAILTLALQVVEYRWLIIGHSFEVYGAIIAALFAGVGIWAGRAITRARTEIVERHVETVVVREVPVPVPAMTAFVRDERQVTALGLTPRELDILEAIAAGLSNREIGERLHVSENTVKTHSSRVFEKLGVQRRVQAVMRGRELRLIP